MTTQFVCPACRGQLNYAENKETRGVDASYTCLNCNIIYPTRDKTPSLIYPQPDTKNLEVMYSGGSTKRRKFFLKRALDLLVYRVKTAGWRIAFRMVPTYLWSRLCNKTIIILSAVSPIRKVKCSCCGWQGIKFGVYWGTLKNIHNFACPACGSHPRHRMLSQYIPQWVNLDSTEILHFAPERFLEVIFERAESGDNRITTDITLAGVSCLSNINYLPFENKSFEYMICIHVLEHIKDDMNAMRELYRVLKDDGVAVICVPETDSNETVEFGFEDPTKSHHWRDYGKDVKQRLIDAGFDVDTVTPKSLGADCKRYGLEENERFYLCSPKSGA